MNITLPFSNTMLGGYSSFGPRAMVATGVLVCYLALCRALRYRRRDQRHAQYPYKTREDFSRMTADHAWEITNYIVSLEFPLISRKALSFALFKTYGIPTISTLLCETQQLSTATFASRRYADTDVILSEIASHPPSSERTASALARMNFLHRRYQKAGKISNDDMLYTLSLFVLEIVEWVRLYEWRPLTDMEVCAIATHWHSIALAMNIDLTPLGAHTPNSLDSKTPQDGLTFFHAVRSWANAYETRTMLPSNNNHTLAEQTAAILLFDVPGFLKPWGMQFVIALMGERLRIAMMYDKPSAVYTCILSAIFATRKLVLRWCVPPRPESWGVSSVSVDTDKGTGRFWMTGFEGEPWYFKPTFYSRFLSPWSWYRWAIGRAYPDGKRYQPEGYDILEVGPERLKKHGREDCEEERHRLMESGRGGRCPFAVS